MNRETPVNLAQRLAQGGQLADALSVLNSAARADDPDAAMQLAVWHLTNEHLPRDLAAARAHLRRAVDIGHVDAALMEIAMTANGSGGPADWGSAVALLEKAAKADPVAAEHLALLRLMLLDEGGYPAPSSVRAPVILCEQPRTYRFENFCTKAECAHLAQLAAPMLEPARVYHPSSGRWVDHPVRQSDNAAIGPTNETLVVSAINRRIAVVTGTDPECGEPLTILRYRPGQRYRKHHDCISGANNQRNRTAIIYLNDNFAGGETAFPSADFSVTPCAGDLLVFDNVDDRGRPEPKADHEGRPVIQGVKWLATR